MGPTIDWTQVLIALIAAAPATLAVYLSYRIHYKIRTPSGDDIGTVVERTHELAAVNEAVLLAMHSTLTGGAPPPRPTRKLGG